MISSKYQAIKPISRFGFREAKRRKNFHMSEFLMIFNRYLIGIRSGDVEIMSFHSIRHIIWLLCTFSSFVTINDPLNLGYI